MVRRGVQSTSVLCFKYKDGVVIAADTAASYGSLALTGAPRLHRLTDNCIVAFTGNHGDIQTLLRTIKAKLEDDPQPIGPQGIHRLIQHHIYDHRNRLELLNLAAVVCGVSKTVGGAEEWCKQGMPITTAGTPPADIISCSAMCSRADADGRFIGVVNSKGGFWFEDAVGTGLGAHVVLPFIREQPHMTMDRAAAEALMDEALRLLFYKDCQAGSTVQIAFCEAAGVTVGEPHTLETNWELGIAEGETVLQE